MTSNLDKTNVFVKYLPADVDDEGLRSLFSTYGEIISSKVMIDHQTGLSLGYGFVRFATIEETQEAITGMTGYRLNNKVLLCKLSNSSTNSSNPEISNNLYIRPLPSSIGEGDLRTIFASFGAINACKVMVDKITGESIQIGFVRFDNQEDATAALTAMNGKKLVEDQAAINVKYAETEIQRKERKSRIKTPVASPPPSPSSPTPTSPTYYYPTPPVVFRPVTYIPVSPTNYMPQSFMSPDFMSLNDYSSSPDFTNQFNPYANINMNTNINNINNMNNMDINMINNMMNNMNINMNTNMNMNMNVNMMNYAYPPVWMPTYGFTEQTLQEQTLSY